MPTADIPVSAARTDAIARSVIVESRDHVARKLRAAVEPCFGYVDISWLRKFADAWTLSGRWQLGNLDHLAYRAMYAAQQAEEHATGQPVTDRREFLNNAERAVYRAAEDIAFTETGEQLLAAVDGLRTPPTKDWLLQYADDLSMKPISDDLVTRILDAADAR
jgi:hypothetical protein